MKNQNLLDQFFLIDKNVTELIIGTAELDKRDTVLEIGAGSGIVTKKLVEEASKTIAVEIDQQFKKDLKKIHGKLRVVFDDGLRVLKEKRYKFNKIVGSLPSSIIEPLMHILTKIDFDLAVFLVPLKFAYKLTNDRVLVAYFDTKVVDKVSRKSFFPIPRTNWAVVKMTKKPSALLTKDLDRFLTQYIYEHPKAKLANSAVEGLIKFCRCQGKNLTKNEAQRLLASKNPPAFFEKSGGF